MDFNIKTGQPEKQKTACLILPVHEQGKLAEVTGKYDKKIKGAISKIVKMGDITGKIGESLVLHNPSTGISRVLLIGCGKKSAIDDAQFRSIVKSSASAFKGTGAKDACCYISELNVRGRDLEWKIQQATRVVEDSEYSFDQFKSNKSSNSKKKISWIVNGKPETTVATKAMKIGLAIAQGMKLTKDLANMPANICTPTYLAKEAAKVAKQFPKVSCKVHNKKDLEKMKMGAFLSVTQGSVQPPKLVTLEYKGTASAKQPIVFVGKGITFDTGGNSIKPAAAMIGMKYDMCGAATVLGLIKFAALVKLPLNIVGIMAAAENMPGSTASRPDDIVKTMSGLTVEILNTDAEGRLVLSDALTYAGKFKPKVVIDMATLTGACVVALGNHNSGMYSNNQPLANGLLNAPIIEEMADTPRGKGRFVPPIVVTQ